MRAASRLSLKVLHFERDLGELNDLGAGFEITKGYKIGHGPDANIQHAVGQGGLF